MVQGPGAASLRSRILILVLLGVVLPLGLVGLWLTDSTRRSGEELVRERLAEALEELVQTTGSRWTGHRAAVLNLASTPAVQRALTRSVGSDLVDRPQLRRAWERVARVADRATIWNLQGAVVLRLPDVLLEDATPTTPEGPGLLSVSFPIDAPYPGERLGTLEAQLRVGTLVPTFVLASGVGGSVLAVFDLDENPLIPLALDPTLFEQERFRWGDEEWLTVERSLREPPLRFAMAAPTGAFQRPFAEAARRGIIALIAVAVGAIVLTTVLTRRFTASLENLSEAADRVASGELSQTTEEAGPPEVARTARAFNAMMHSLRRSLQRLSQQEAVAAVGEFAASLAHEVRNPLQSVQLSLERAQRQLRGEPDKAERLLERALGEIQRLNDSVGDSLRIARSGRLSPKRIDLREPLEAATRAAEPHFDRVGVKLTNEVPAHPIWVRADEGAVEQLVLNLLLNAADAAAGKGNAGVTVEKLQDAVHVRVWDSGEGIEPEHLDQIFEPFYSTRNEGTGLGLSIAQRIVRAHGSELSVDSRPGVGTTFSFCLPDAAAAAPTGSDRDGLGGGTNRYGTRREG